MYATPQSKNNINANGISYELKLENATEEGAKQVTWRNKWEFILSCIGFSVGIGNVWRFPYLAYKNGGGAFLIPYLIMLFLAGKPLYFMELAFGQFTSCSSINVWNCVPLARGIGISMVFVSIVISTYYCVIIAFALYYLWFTFRTELPWQRCDVEWAEGINCTLRNQNNNLSNSLLASELFWQRKVLDISPGIGTLGHIKWDLALCLFICWTICALCIIKGIKSSGRAVWVTATFPYLILIALLITGCIQKGAWDGIKFFLIPEWKKLLEMKVWQAAAGQMFYSLGISIGSLIMFSSYNDFHHNVFRDATIVSILDTFTSVIAGLVIFSVLGAMSHDMGVPLTEVVSSGFGLGFVAYPEALAQLPVPQLWSCLFFLMLITLGLGSEFALLENIVTPVSDVIPILHKNKRKLCVSVCLFCYLIGLFCVTRGGFYVIDVMDYFGVNIPLLFIALCECVTVMWIYGIKRFKFDLEYMLGRKLGLYWHITWAITCPLTLAFIFVFALIEFNPLQYGNYGDYNWIGLCLTLFIIMPIPVWAIVVLVKQMTVNERNVKQGFIDKLSKTIHANEKWGPKDCDIRREWKITHLQRNANKYKEKLNEINNQLSKLELKEQNGNIENGIYISRM